jgi:hypothetical protein
MNIFYEQVKSYLSPAPDFLGVSNTTTQSEYIRNRYYQNLTYIERMAKAYGELNFIFKWGVKINLTCGAGVSFFFMANPFIATILLASLPFLLFLEEQYKAMEIRFRQLVDDVDVSQKKLDELIVKNKKLEEQLVFARESSTEIIKELAQKQVEIEEITTQLKKTKDLAQHASKIIEDSAKAVHEVIAKLDNSETETKELLDCLVLLCKELRETKMVLLSQQTTIVEFDEVLKDAIFRKDKMCRYIEEKYGDVLKSTDISDMQYFSIFNQSHHFCNEYVSVGIKIT